MKRIVIPARVIKGLTGTTTGILEHTRRLTDLGYSVELFGEKLDLTRINKMGGIPNKITRFPFGKRFRRHLFALRFEKHRQRNGFDFVFGHGDVYSQDVLSLHDCIHAQYQAIRGRPMLKQTSVGGIHKKILSERNFKYCIANSQLMKDDITRRFSIPPEIIRVIHPGYDPDRFGLQNKEADRAEIREQLNVSADEILVGIITSGNYKKRGLGIFISALAKLSPQIRSMLQVVVIGKEKNVKSYQEEADQAGVGDRMRFLPATPKVEKYFHALDIYAFPAVFEEFGQSVQEAFVCGVPVITSRLVGASELLGPDYADFLLDKPDPEGVCHKMSELITNPELRNKLAEIGVKAAQANTWDNNFKQTLEVLNENGL